MLFFLTDEKKLLIILNHQIEPNYSCFIKTELVATLFFLFWSTITLCINNSNSYLTHKKKIEDIIEDWFQIFSPIYKTTNFLPYLSIFLNIQFISRFISLFLHANCWNTYNLKKNFFNYVNANNPKVSFIENEM